MKRIILALASFAFVAAIAVVANAAATGQQPHVFDVAIVSVAPDGVVTLGADTPNRALACKDTKEEACAHQWLAIPQGQWGAVMGGADFSAWRTIAPKKGLLLKAIWDSDGAFVAVDCQTLTHVAEKNYLLVPRGCGKPSPFIVELVGR